MALFPFIFIRNKALAANAVLINHERIHLRQQAELLFVPFYIWYLTEYAIRRLQYKTQSEAYRNISFEREAYANDRELGYLEKRRFWDFLKYLKTPI